MAIEIKELHVRLFMGNASSPGPVKGGGGGEQPETDPCSDQEKHEQLVSDTAQEVLRILKARERR